MSEVEGVVVGIDIAKAALDAAVRPRGEERHRANDAAGIAELVAWLQLLGPQVLVVEATGGSEAARVAALGIAGLPVAVVNPRQVRDCARATGRVAKTDRLDAQALAHVGQAVRPTPRPRPDKAAQAWAALLERRRQVVALAHGGRTPSGSTAGGGCARAYPGAWGGVGDRPARDRRGLAQAGARQPALARAG